uniref:Transforming acidic coiled-coil containing protein 2 n=1 Tax=Leptobrachium leishanense TaxID=445787 RepID=A0A8C5R5D6_9ANUR
MDSCFKQEPQLSTGSAPGRVSQGSGQYKEIAARKEETHSFFAHENTGSLATSLSGDGSLLNVWEEGQLLPTHPLSDLNIEDLEYKECESRPHPGTISVPFNEDYTEDATFSEEVGLIGILREWGKDVLPEKIPTKSEQEEPVLMPVAETKPQDSVPELRSLQNLQISVKSSGASTSQDCTDHKDCNVSTVPHYNTKDAVTPDTWEEGKPSNRPLPAPPRIIPEPSQLFSKNAVSSELNGEPGSPDSTCMQAKGDSKDSITSLESQLIFYDGDVAAVCGADNQTSRQNDLIMPGSTDGSSDRNREKFSLPISLLPEACAHSGELPVVLDLESKIIVSEFSNSGGLWDKSITNNQPPVLAPMQNEKLVECGKDPDDTDRVIKKRPLIDTVHVENINQEFSSRPDVTMKSTTKGDVFDLKDKPEEKTYADVEKCGEEIKTLPDSEKSDGVQITKINEGERDLFGMKHFGQELGLLVMGGTSAGSENLESNLDQRIHHESGTFNKKQTCWDTENTSLPGVSYKLGDLQELFINKEDYTKIQTNVENQECLLITNVRSMPELFLHQSQGVHLCSSDNTLSTEDKNEVDKNSTEKYDPDDRSNSKKLIRDQSYVSTNEQEKAAAADTETTHLSVSVSALKMGYTPPTQLHNLMIESAQLLEAIYENLSGGEEPSIMKPPTESSLPFTDQSASFADCESSACLGDQHEEVPMNVFEEIASKIQKEIQQHINDVADKTELSDSNARLMLSVLRDVGNLSLPPDGTIEESHKVQPAPVTPNNLEIIEEGRIGTDMDIKNIENEETLNQPESQSSGDTPCVSFDKPHLHSAAVSEPQDFTRKLDPDPLAISLSERKISKNGKGKDEIQTHGVSSVADVVETSGLQGKTTASELSTEGLLAADCLLLGFKYEAQSANNLDSLSKVQGNGVSSLKKTNNTLHNALERSQNAEEISQILGTGNLQDKVPVTAASNDSNCITDTGVPVNELHIEPEAISCVSDKTMDPNIHSRATFSLHSGGETLSVDTCSGGQIEDPKPKVCEKDERESNSNLASSTFESAVKVMPEDPANECLEITQKDQFLGLLGHDTCSLNITALTDPMNGEVCSANNVKPTESLTVGRIHEATSETNVGELLYRVQSMPSDDLQIIKARQAHGTGNLSQVNALPQVEADLKLGEGINYQTISKLPVEAAELTINSTMPTTTESVSKKAVTDNAQDIQSTDNKNSTIANDGAGHLELVQSAFDQTNVLSEFAHEYSATTGKLPDSQDIQSNDTHQEIHPQEKHLDNDCEGTVNSSSDRIDAKGQNVPELLNLNNDEVYKPTNLDLLEEATRPADTIPALENSSTPQSLPQDSSSMSYGQAVNICSSNTATSSQVDPMEKAKLPSEEKVQKDFLQDNSTGSAEIDVPSLELGAEDIAPLLEMGVESIKMEATYATSYEPEEYKATLHKPSLHPQLNCKEIMSEPVDLKIKQSAKTSEEPDLAAEWNTATPIKLEAIAGSYPSSKETDILSDISDELGLTPREIESMSENASPLPDELAPVEEFVATDNMQGTILGNAKMPIVKCGPSSVETGLSEKESTSDEPSCASEPPGSAMKEQDLGIENNSLLPPLKPDADAEMSYPTHEKLVSLDNESAPIPPVFRSPVFPTPDSGSFIQKLRSVLHSERPVLKTAEAPKSPDPLELPSSPRLPAEGAVPERSSDSEEAFETPESTTPVKSAPPVPIPLLPEVQELQPQPREPEEILAPPVPPENADLLSCLENILAAEISEVEHSEERPSHQPSDSFTLVFDEDKPIASSGTYNLDFNSVHSNDGAGSSEAPARTRRKSTDSVPAAKNTLSRSLSLQASDFQIEDVTFGQGGSDSACSTLRRTKKPRPASLKKKPSKKQQEALGAKETNQDVTGESQEAEVQVSQEDSPPLPQTEPDLPLEQSTVFPSTQESSVDSQEVIIGTVSLADSYPSQETGKSSPSLVCLQDPELAPADIEGPDTIGVIGQSVRLEFDYSEEAREGQPPIRKGKKPSGKMPLRKPKPKKAVEKSEHPPESPSHVPVADPNDIPIAKGSYTYNLDNWDDPNFNPFSSGGKMPDSLPSSQEHQDQFKTATPRSESPAKMPASFEIPTNAMEQNNAESSKPTKKKKTPLKTDTFRVKKSPKRSPVSENGSEELTILTKSEAPPVITSEEHATDEEKLASSVGSQKWTCMAVDLEAEKQDYPQPSDLTSFVNENQFHASTDDIEYGNSYNIEYMEKTGTLSPLCETAQPQSVYLMFEATQDSPVKTPAKFSETYTPGTDSSFDGIESTLCSRQIPCQRTPTIMQDSIRQPLDRARQREEESSLLGSGKMELGSPDDAYVAAETLLSRISHQPSLCDQLSYLEPDLAEKNPQAFAQKLQEELEFAAMRIEALKLARHISLSSQCALHTEGLESADSGLSHNSLYSRAVAMETTGGGLLLPYQQSNLDTALQLAREEIAAKESEVIEWKRKYEESRCEVVEMRKIVAEYEQTIAQMIEDEQREKSVSHHTVQQLIMEKEQALADLNSVEKSLADLFRRYEKMKDVLEGFRKNEEVLKKCAQEYLARVKKEEQRYHALKIHAEEKLDRANADIAQVRCKSQQEHAAYQASLRKEQLKVDALERTLEQKNKEIEELTKICDELIMKMGKS